jgi:hypothetical protein
MDPLKRKTRPAGAELARRGDLVTKPPNGEAACVRSFFVGTAAGTREFRTPSGGS